jgi:hypothetical protein
MAAGLRRLELGPITRPNAVVTAGSGRSEPGPITRPNTVVTTGPRRLEPGPIARPGAETTARLRRRAGGGRVTHHRHIGGWRCALEQPRQQQHAAVQNKSKRDEPHENAVAKWRRREYRSIRCWGCFGVCRHGGDPWKIASLANLEPLRRSREEFDLLDQAHAADGRERIGVRRTTLVREFAGKRRRTK